MQPEAYTPEPIAIVGSGCRLPGGATSPSKLWEILKDPRDLISEISSKDRFLAQAFHHENEDHHGSTNVTKCYLLEEDYRVFDHEFFGIHRREAESMDPQQKMMLEVVYEAIEAAGYSIDSLRGSNTGAFVGQMTDDYREVLLRDVQAIPRYAGTGISRAILANRLSYYFDWHGPSMNIDTACSSSLVALHQAVQALRSGESTVAIAAGSNIILGPETFVMESNLHMLSPSGQCRMWDADCKGYGRGEGLAVIVLKTLSRALSDNDHIECLVRETGVNQDGRSQGLTVPNPVAQSMLIQSTYAKCGLDPTRAEDSCQLFEAHGTGTAAGDTKEAEAIRNVFFPGGEETFDDDGHTKARTLHVGSVKTVLGHTEGAAGLVGVLKASLALQNSQIPPNMHFERLNPTIEPFYNPHLRIPTRLEPWPETIPSTPRRASVNSFGFGGTNAHAILESWEEINQIAPQRQGASPIEAVPDLQHTRPVDGPIILSGHSRNALKRGIKNLSQILPCGNDPFDMERLVGTLQSRRTELPFRAVFTATTIQDLVHSMDAFVEDCGQEDNSVGEETTLVTPDWPLRVLGVFTGQGAQWPRMGARLMETSPAFRHTIQQLDESLARLPDAPPWSLAQELSAHEDISRVQTAEIAQPLTTALQIGLLGLLSDAGIGLTAVVGHSSGEIAAAYYAGYLSADDAIRVAFYRGLHSQLAQSPTGEKTGSMMAVSMTLEEATAFCKGVGSQDRISVAASNGPMSVTISGDSSAIEEAKSELDSRRIFNRVLKVDKAYHSQHMQPCIPAYLESLSNCAIKLQRSNIDGKCTWYSSVYGSDGRSIHDPDALRAQYWAENLIKPVSFYAAISRAVREQDCCFDLVLEIGPHPVLRVPVNKAITTLTGVEIPYSGLLSRGSDDRVAFSNAVGSIWTKFRVPIFTPPIVQWRAFRGSLYGHDVSRPPRPMKCLPTYSWDHSDSPYFESRQSRRWAISNRPSHPLLGKASVQGSATKNSLISITWRNILKLNELEWLCGHKFQRQVIFPAAGYVCMAIDAAAVLSEEFDPKSDPESIHSSTTHVELNDLRFHNALTLEEDSSSGVEMTFIMRVVHWDPDRRALTADYTCYTGDINARPRGTRGNEDGSTSLAFSGKASIHLPTEDRASCSPLLPHRTAPDLPLSSVDTIRFYTWTSTIDLDYSGDFLIESIHRRRDLATVLVPRAGPKSNEGLPRIYPPALDATFQGLFAAFSFPGDQSLTTAHLPSGVDRVIVDLANSGPCNCQNRKASHNDENYRLLADCYIRQRSAAKIVGDVEVFCAYCESHQVQIEGLALSRISPPIGQEDRALFSHTIWDRDVASCGVEIQCDTESHRMYRASLNEACDRTAYFYLVQLCEEFSRDAVEMMEWHFRCLIEWVQDSLRPKVNAGRQSRIRLEWAFDKPEKIQELRRQFPDRVEMQIVHEVGQVLPQVLRASIFPTSNEPPSVLATLMRENLLGELYHHAEGFSQANYLVGLVVGQLAHRYPNMNILELGGGTGAATARVMPRLADRFSSYVFTDISAAFFHDAKIAFANGDGEDKLRFAVLDLERNPRDQGFLDHSFDLIIASNVLHATKSLSRSLSYCRQLLRPGGFLVMDEVTSDTVWGPFIVSGLPGWWLGHKDDGRKYGPLVSESRWHQLLKDAGFSGVDHAVRDTEDETAYMFSVMVSQATNDEVEFLRAPLKYLNTGSHCTQSARATGSTFTLGDVVVIGGEKDTPDQTAIEACSVLEPFSQSTKLLSRLEELALEVAGVPKGTVDYIETIKAGSTVICLDGLAEENPTAPHSLSSSRLRALQTLFRQASNILWVTRNYKENPQASICVALGRTMICESPHLRLLLVDLDNIPSGVDPEPGALAQMLIRMVFLDSTPKKEILWSNETEISLRDGVVYIPRIRPLDQLNSRLASTRRRISEDIQAEAISSVYPIEVDIESDGRIALRSPMARVVTENGNAGDIFDFTSYYSSIFAFNSTDSDDPRHICLGTSDYQPGQWMITLLATNVSSCALASRQMIRCGPLEQGPTNMLHHLLAVLMCESLLNNVSGTLWLHEAPENILCMLETLNKTSGKNVPLFFTTCSGSPGNPRTSSQPLKYLHPRTTTRSLTEILPSRIGRLCFFNKDAISDTSTLRDTLVRSKVVTADQITTWYQDVSKSNSVPLKLPSSRILDILSRECESQCVQTCKSTYIPPSSTSISLRTTSSISGTQNIIGVLDWATQPGSVPADSSSPDMLSVRISPLSRNSKPIFSSMRTYLLAGLANEIGMSLIEWMSGLGGRHFAIISRNPRFNAAFLQKLSKNGVIVRTWAVDIADRAALSRAHREMDADMPPIAGVANGAMVLRDRPFDDMSFEDFETAMRPKAQGTHNLDELFYQDHSLEFFILFASVACIAGNPGQANYSAANMYMASIAEQRRRRGLASSVLYLGMILGVGHVARALEGSRTGNRLESQLLRTSYLPLSEDDLHTAFAEAVYCGRPSSQSGSDIIVGLGDGKQASWRSIPRFSSWVAHLEKRSHFTKARTKSFHSAQSSSLALQGSIRKQLHEARVKSRANASSMLESAFTVKLGVILQKDAAKLQMTVPLVQLGIDSLVAVELRSWILKELGVNIPILKLLGDASLRDICREASNTFFEMQEGSNVVSKINAGVNESRVPKSFPMPIDPIPTWRIHGGNKHDSESEYDPVPGRSSTETNASYSRPSETQFVRMGRMSPAQARLYFLHQYLDDKSAYNVGYVGRYSGTVDSERLEKALWDVCGLNESLRSCYFLDVAQDRAIQAVLEHPRPAFQRRDIKDEREFEAELAVQRKRVFDIEHGELVKVTILSLTSYDHYIIFLHHHIAVDGISWFLFLKQLDQSYSGKVLVPPVQQSIAMSGKQWLHVDDLERDLAFWRKVHTKPHDPLPLFSFSKVKNRQVLKRYQTETVEMELEPELATRIKRSAAALGTTAFTFCLAALAVFIKRCVQTDDFSIGIVNANRPDAEDSTTMGYFLNMLPLRFDLLDHENGEHFTRRFDHLLQKCRRLVHDSLSHASAPFDAILNEVSVSRSGSHHPLFQVALDYRQGYSAEDKFASGKIRWDIKHSITARNPYDIFINVTQTSESRTFLHWTTQQYMYSASDGQLMMTWYTRILHALACEPSMDIADCPIANHGDIQHAIELGAGGRLDSSPGFNEGTLIHRVDAMVHEHANAVALIDGDCTKLTYAGLQSRVFQIARCLKQNLLRQGVDLDRHLPASIVVATLIHPTNDFVCSILAIMRLGIVCIGLDLRNPEERLDVMLSDCRPKLLVCQTSTKDQAHRHAALLSAEVVDIDTSCISTHRSDEIVENRSILNQPAVILYTSGSTGVPKGVLLSHRNLHSHIMANTSLFKISSDDVILHQTSPGFDFCLDQIFHALGNGGRLVIISKEGRGDPVHIAERMLEFNVTMTVGCPSEYLALLNYGLESLRKCRKWRVAFSGGEKLTYQLRKSFQKLQLRQLQFVNVYGPTEVTIAVARGEVPYKSDEDLEADGDFLYPMPKYSVLIVDNDMKPLPVGFPGEVLIAGDGVAMGYLNRKEETERRFLQLNSSFEATGALTSKVTPVPTLRVYRSGDHGRILPDGSVHLLGRVNEGQIKVRGMRVELAEIANVMIRESGGAITAAAVSYRPLPLEILVAFVVFDIEFEASRRESLIQSLKTNLPLPAHMCPAAVIEVTELPRNVNGKLDRRAIDSLPLPDIKHVFGYEANAYALTDTESRMKKVWFKVLGAHEPRNDTLVPAAIGAQSDFFLVGGNSMLAIKLRAGIKETFHSVLTLPELFQLRTLAKMAARVKRQRLQTALEAEQVRSSGFDVAAEVTEHIQYISSLAPESQTRAKSSSSGYQVVLTGATGFLGTHILQQLVSDPRVSQVHCIAMRPGRHLKLASTKAIEHHGDLSEPLLGLSQETFTELAHSVDLIIHNGAHVSFLEPYDSSLRGPNVLSTRTLSIMALKRRVPLHFVSTASVAGLVPRPANSEESRALGPVSVAHYVQNKESLLNVNGYTLSKVVSEALLERVGYDYGLPTFIHRAASLSGPDAPDHDIMNTLVRCSRILASVPVFGNGLRVTGGFDFVPVELVGGKLAGIAVGSISTPTSSCSYSIPNSFVHHCSEVKVPANGLQGYMERLDGSSFSRTDCQDWIQAAREVELENPVLEYLAQVVEDGEELNMPLICSS